MDVRCEKCQTLYELDDVRLHTNSKVECASCGHRFRIGRPRRSTTQSADGGPVSDTSESEPKPIQKGMWKVKTEKGETLDCPDPVTLQKWIASGKVTRDASISKSGENWKPLRDVAGLAEFFDVAEEAERHHRDSKSPEEPRAQSLSGSVRKPTDDGMSGPTGGVARITAERVVEPAAHRFAHLADDLDDEDEEPIVVPGSRVGRWVVVFSLLVLAGAGAAIYFKITPGSEQAQPPPEQPLPETPDKNVVEVPPETPPEAPPEVVEEDPLEQGITALLEDSSEVLEAAAQTLGGHAPSDPLAANDVVSVDALVVRARVEAALAQLAHDNGKNAQVASRVRSVKALVSRALEITPDHPGAVVAESYALRLSNEPSRKVERVLRKAATNEEWSYEASLSKGLLHLRDKRFHDARRVLQPLVESAPEGDQRARYRLAQTELAAGNADAAKKLLQSVTKARPDHARAQKLLASVAETPATTPTETPEDPMPPETPRKPPVATPPTPSMDSASYDQLVRRADDQAENGRCGSAMALYERALSKNSRGVGALTGKAYCQLDGGKYGAAAATFQKALAVSPRYQPALWGLAETHERKGDRSAALAAYKKFVELHPGSRRADVARRNIERLGP